MPASRQLHCMRCGNAYPAPKDLNGPGCPNCEKPAGMGNIPGGYERISGFIPADLAQREFFRRATASTSTRTLRRWRKAFMSCLAYAFNNRGPVADWLFMFFLLLMLVHSVFSEQF